LSNEKKVKMKKILSSAVIGFLPILAFGQFVLSGKITDNDNQPLVSASIVIEDTYLGTYSDKNGKFSFRNLKKDEYSIKISFIGYNSETLKIYIDSDKDINISLSPSAYLTDEVSVQASRLDNFTPMAFSNMNKTEIEKNNLGQDIPFLISLMPSVVSSSDAGAGVGYTNLNIRGSDIKRINVMVNGIPMNDSESHGVWWVNMPDLASSTDNIQVQRGVGTSVNGAGAFGASLNMQTTSLNHEAYSGIAASYGSFNTYKTTLSAGTGLLDNNFAFDIRMSKIASDGFIDRAYSDLKSFYASGGWYGEKDLIKLVIFSGKEKTYQAWNGVPKVKLNNDKEGMDNYLNHGLYSQEEYNHMLASDSRTYNYYRYKNETDNYQQDHYQIHYSREFNKNLHLSSAIHYTYGRGYYESYKENRRFSAYGLSNFILGNDTLRRSNFIHQKWLDNDFYGFTSSIKYNKNRLSLIVGGGANRYEGLHFGDVIWASHVTFNDASYRWYENKGDKKDINAYLKANYQVNDLINSYVDLQIRNINYTINGLDDDLSDINQNHNFSFFNPKAGLVFNLADNQKSWISVAIANREPTRSDFIDADEGKTPKYETMIDYEAGYEVVNRSFRAGINLFYMDYANQLIMTGKINNVGAPIMVNVENSYRRGIEIEGQWNPNKFINWSGNISFSNHKIRNFEEYVDDWDTWSQVSKNLGKTDISFSPNVVAGSIISFIPIEKVHFNIISKYVGRQYIDNTSSNDRMLNPYFINDVSLLWYPNVKLFKNSYLHFKVNNILNVEYETYAWVYRYYFGGSEYAMDGYFPQAGRNYLMGLVLRF